MVNIYYLIKWFTRFFTIISFTFLGLFQNNQLNNFFYSPIAQICTCNRSSACQLKVTHVNSVVLLNVNSLLHTLYFTFAFIDTNESIFVLLDSRKSLRHLCFCHFKLPEAGHRWNYLLQMKHQNHNLVLDLQRMSF